MNGFAAPTIGAPSRPLSALSERAREALCVGALVALTLLGAAIAVTAAGGSSFDVPASHAGMPGWMAGVMHGLAPTLTSDQFVLALALMVVLWGVVIGAGARIRASWVIAAVVLLHFLFTIAPPLMSKDIFSYVSYARLGVLHGVNPYATGAFQFPGDPSYPFTAWRHTGSAYGPLFTIASYPLAVLGVPAAMWVVKLVTGAFSLALVWITWRCAQRLGRDPVRAAVWVGLNPVLLVYGVGGAHNDLIMLFLMMAGVWFALGRRENVAGAALVASVAVKASGAVMLPYLFLQSRDRRRLVTGAALTAGVLLVMALLAFAGHALGVLTVLKTQQLLVSGDAIPNQVAKMVGLPGITSDVRLVCRLLTLGTLVWLGWRVWRGRTDWITASGWAMVALVVGSSWLLGWYVLWPLPFAAVTRDRRLQVAAFALIVYFVAMRWSVFIT